MKTLKRLISLSIVIVIAVSAWAVPAYRGWQTKIQPNGSTITIRQTGDEFFHYWENEEGQQVKLHEDGWWRVLDAPAVQSEVSKQKQASRKYNQRGGGSKARKAAGQINLAPRGLVILVNFSDVTYRSGNTRAAMSDLMNSENYTYNSATGSVREFFKAQSNGAYVPDFDVVGPYNLTNTRAHYGANDSGGDDVLAGDMIVEACKAADADGVDFTQYNNDGDSYVDFVYVIYAGEGEADSDEEDAIWPHNWDLESAEYYNNCTYTASQRKVDNLYINNYACSGELRGRSTTRCPIGTITHEFGHVLGLPDYYVTSKSAANYPYDYTPGSWHIMDYGSYNNDGRTPPNYSPHDKLYFGWYTINTSSSKFLAKDAKANGTLTTTYGSWYQITGTTSSASATSTSRVWYLENRQKSGWDEYLPGHGMVVWEVQYNSSNWTNNTPNNSSVGYTVVTANNLTRPYEPYVDETTASSTSGTTFPGTSNVTSYTPATGCTLTNITESAGKITFKYNGGVSVTEWSYTLYGDHCTYPDDGTVLKNAALNLTITPSSGYTLADASCWEVTMGGTPLTYGTGFTYNAGTGAFSIASVTGDVEILVEGKRTVTWNVAGVTNTTFFSEGAALVLPTKPADCSGSGGKKFVGWTANSTVTGSAPADLFSTAGTKTVTANPTYYAVYATASAGGGPTTATYGFEDADDDTNWDISAAITKSADAKSTGTYGGIINTNHTYVTYTQKVKVTNFSFQLKRTSNNSNYNVYVETSSNGTDWTAAETYGMGTFNNGSFSSKSKDFDGETALYVRFHCYNTTAVRHVDNFSITYGGGTTYSDYSLTCSAPEPCTHQISVSKGTPSNGDFSIDKTGSQDNCSVGGLVVTVSGITPAEGYEFGAITQTGIASGVTIDQEAKTVTYSKDVEGSSTINVTFTEKPTYKIRFYDGATKLKEEDLVSGATATPPSNPAGCTEYTFYGWWTETLASSNTTAHKVTDFTVSGAQDYYAVYSHTTGGGGSTTATYGFEDADDDTNWDISAAITKSADAKSTGTYGGIINTNHTYVAYTQKVKVTNFSFELKRTSNNSNYNVSVETSSNGTDWTAAETYTMGSFANGSFTPQSKDFDGNTALYVRFHCNNTTAVRHVDNFSITYGGGGTTYYTTTAECVECTNKVTLTKGTPSNGTFALDKADGEYNNCAAGGLVVTVSGITPADGYRFKEITQTGIASGVTIDQEGKTVTYAKDVKGASTINVVFELIPTYTVTWSSNGDESNTAEYHEGDAIVFPSSADGCDDKTFMGWVSATIPTPQDEEPTFVTSATMPAHAVTYYAVFADEDEGGGGGSTYTLVEESLADWSGNYIIVNYSDNNKAMKNTVSGGEFGSKDVSPSSKKITTTDNTIIWIFEKGTGANASKYSVKSKDSGKYAGIGSNTTSGSLNDAASYFEITHYTSHQNDVAASSGRFFSYYSDNATFRTYAGSSPGVYLYRSSTSYSGYSTSCILPTEVTVTFDANGGEGTMAAQVMDYNTATALNTNTFTREGYTFQGWATSTSGAKVYNDEALVTLKKNTTLYAVWQKNSYTITLVDPAHGSIETSPATTAEYGATVTVTVTPSGGYTFGSMTVTNNTTSGTVATSGSGATQTFTMPASDVTITATVTEIPTYTVTWSSNGDESNQVNYYEGDAIVFPGTATGCEGKTFMGWSAVTVAEQDVAPAYTTSATMPAHDVTYYAVFAEASSGSGVPTTETYGFEDSDDDTNWTIDANITKSTSAKATGTYGGIINTAETYITFNNKVKVTNFSFKLARTSNNANYTVYIETSTDGSVWTEAESYAMSSFSNGSFTPKSKDFDGSTDLYVRLYCYNTTAIRYIDDISITYGGGTTYSGYSTTCGASISAQNIGWMTTAAGQKVKRVINVSAKNFDDPTTLTATCANSNFAVALGASAVPAGTTGLTTTLTVEYTPTASDTRDENVEIVLTAGDKSRTITVSGRSVPDEFLLITKKSSTWYALPANMNSGANEYNGVEVSPNDATTPTSVAVSPTTLIYNLASVASSRYTANGHLVRLVGNSNKCLWGNKATGATKVNIQNYAVLSESNGDNYEWDLKTTDGVRYYVESPCNAEYAEGRRLAYGTKFGMYKEETVFFIVRAGCTSQPGEVNVSPRRVDATFSWVSNTTEMHIDLYTNDAMTEGHLSRTASSSPYVFHGLAESTDYWYKLTPGSDTECAVTGTFKTSGPIIDIVEWHEDEVVLFIDKGDINPVIVIDGQEEHGSITGGGNATELFFAKYFEGAGSMKLVSVFNGTKEAINLTNYSIIVRMRGSGGSWSGDVPLNLSSLGSINAGQEIIFFSRPLSTETALDNCSSSFLDDKVANSSSAESNPRWVECDGSTFPKINFNGNDPILLKKSGDIIDIIGSQGTAPTSYNCLSGDNEKGWAGTVRNMDKGKSPSDPVFDAFYAATTLSPVTTQDSIDLLTAFGINLDDDEIALTTARCILFRDKRVTSGDSAVLMNETTGTTFVTFTNHDEFKSEWYGRSVCMNDAAKTAAGVSNDAQATCNSYQDIANMDYNQYYIDWTNIEEGKELSTFTSDPETKEYTIPITNMSQYACLNLRFQLKLAGEVLTEAAQQVPIVVTGNVDTNDPLFSELVIDQSTHLPSYSHSVDRCRDCNVVVLGTGTLTKGPDSDEKDVPEIGNLKIYPGGKLIVPTSTEYTVNSLSFRRQEDAVSTADVQGTLNIKNDASKHVYLDFRIDPTNWHYFSLPYDCNVADIRYANPDETDIPVLGTNFLLKYYDGDKRAATQAGGCWEMVSPDATLRKGLGYIFAIPGDGKVKTEFRFPMANGVIADDQNDKMVQGVYGYGCDKDYTQVRANHRGWNLVGNPYFLPYQSKIESPVLNGEIVEDHSVDPWDGHYKFNDPVNDLRYIVEPVDNGWSEYRQVAITDYSMTPFTSYFVQIGGTNPAVEQGIQFIQTQVTGRSSIVRRSPAEYEETEDTHPVWCAVTLTNVNGEKDETTMLISNDFTDNYDIMNDLVKMRGSYYQYKQITTKPVLASRNNEGEMAFNALPDSSALAGIPLNYFAAFQGEYVFAYDNKYDRDGEVKEVKLLDTKTNTWYDLMSESYAFTTNREDNTTRFILSIRVERKTPHVATDLNLTNTPDDRPRKILINDHVYIQRGGAIYDITGKQVLNY